MTQVHAKCGTRSGKVDVTHDSSYLRGAPCTSPLQATWFAAQSLGVGMFGS